MKLIQRYIYENLEYVLKSIALHVGPAIYCGRVGLHVMKCVRGFTCIWVKQLG